MRIGTIEEYIRDSAMERAVALEDTVELGRLREQFPFSVIVEADFIEMDVANRWCWQNFGPRHGECDWTTEYPACPIILETKKIAMTRMQGDQVVEYLDYVDPVKHSHEGVWTTSWFGKTNYNHGFGAFCFSVEEHRSRFMAQVPHVDLGENYA